MRKRHLALNLLFLLLSPSICWADGGGPLLLFINFFAFLYGSVLIVLIEWWVYCKFAKIPTREAFWASVHINIGSTLVVGFGFPFLLGIVTAIFGFIPGAVGTVSLAIGTWVYENVKYPKLTYSMTVIWLAVTFVLTVYYEKKLLVERLAKRGIQSEMDLQRLSWYANGITYLGLLITMIAVGYFGQKTY